MKAVLAVLALSFVVPAFPVLAANADQPYSNVDKRNDAGNDTGNSRVEQLNRGQLDQNQRPAQGLGSSGTTATTPPR